MLLVINGIQSITTNLAMRVLSEWGGEGSRKKRAADESNHQESLKKRVKDHDNNARRHDSIESRGGNKDGNEIRDNHVNKDGFHSSSPSLNQSPFNALTTTTTTESLPSSSSIHPDRLNNIFNATLTTTPTPTPTPTSLVKRESPLSPLPRAPEHTDKVQTDERRK